MPWRLIPLAGVVAFLGIGFGWRAWLHRRRYGSWGIALFQSGCRGQSLREALLGVFCGLLVAQAAAAAVWPALPVAPAWIAGGGLAVLVAGLGLMVLAQLDLGASWRVGIDAGARPGLVTSGLYASSRNPIYVALLVVLAGYALLLPTTLSFGLFAGAAAAIRWQVRWEEAYLERAYGAAYRAYARRVGRFVPGLGRLR